MAWESIALAQVGLMLAQAVIVSAFLILLFRLRTRIGLSLLYIALGVFQYLQSILALAVYVEIYPGIIISPGSVVLFTGSFFAILLVYIREDAIEARKICYGILAASLITIALSILFGISMRLPDSRHLIDLPPALFQQNARLMLIGIAALVADVLLIIVLYEALGQWLRHVLFLRAFVSLALVLALDTLIFVTGGFVEQADYRILLVSGLIGKTVASLFYAAILAFYLRVFEREALPIGQVNTPRDVFLALTFREKYDLLREKSQHDSLTGAYNRGFFDEMLPQQLSLAKRLGLPLSLIMSDIDFFKKVNDRFGHRAGDITLQGLADVMGAGIRGSDFLCRYGGEEFVIVLPNTTRSAARLVAEKIAASLRQNKPAAHILPPDMPITVTMGIAWYPEEGDSGEALVQKADARLYEGKRAGRNCIVG